jgi:hypothetical protein
MRSSIFTLTYSLLSVFLLLTYMQVQTCIVQAENHNYGDNNADENTEEIDFEEEFIDFFNLLDKNELLSLLGDNTSKECFQYLFNVKSRDQTLNLPPPRVMFS